MAIFWHFLVHESMVHKFYWTSVTRIVIKLIDGYFLDVFVPRMKIIKVKIRGQNIRCEHCGEQMNDDHKL